MSYELYEPPPPVPCSPRTIRRCGLLSVIGGAAFVPYALAKGPISATVKAEGISILGLLPGATATLIHLSETLLVILLAMGLFGFVGSRRDDVELRGRLGIGISLVGFVSVIVTHICEHLLQPIPIGGLPGSGGIFVYGYLLSWLLLASGLLLLGLDTWGHHGHLTPAPLALMVTLPAGFVVGGLAVATGVYTFAGVNRLVHAGVWITVGYQLWRQRGGHQP